MTLDVHSITVDCVDWPTQVAFWSARDAEVERATRLGATVVDDRREPDGAGWVVLADPEGNEFCIVRSAAERASRE